MDAPLSHFTVTYTATELVSVLPLATRQTACGDALTSGVEHQPFPALIRSTSVAKLTTVRIVLGLGRVT
jgi:hypothetical protein